MGAAEPIDEENVLVLFGACCCNLGAYCTGGDCCGVATETTCLVLEHACCLKAGKKPLWCACNDGNTCCRLGLGLCSLGLVCPTTCYKNQSQVCCLVHSCALPPDSEIPTTLACFGFACLPYCGCCIPLSTSRSYKRLEGGGPAAPDNTPVAPHVIDSRGEF
mmetsp:Transcript_2914/g.8814  ORF Transcript_2914/g.8814 Transcript_2914/m.8814 type:complete len:162 (-) Transcript_2914:613-1098(-)